LNKKHPQKSAQKIGKGTLFAIPL